MTRRAWIAAASVLAMLSSGFVTAQATATDQRCPDGTLGELVGPDLLCVHGDEPPPPGVDPRRRPELDELRGRRLGASNSDRGPIDGRTSEPDAEPDPDDEPDVAATIRGEAESGSQYQIKCVGDGVSGPRVQAVYAVATDKANRSDSVVPLIRQYAADADLRINRSAAVHQVGRRVRYVTAPLPDGKCQIDVRVVYLSPTGDDTFANTRAELKTQGLARTDRKYVVWVDAAVGICGLGQVYTNDKPTQDNPNNSGPMYARVDAPCWGYAETHELLHTLGAVQQTAPHATGSGHCFDENDTMCYADNTGVTLSSDCPTLPVGWVDCGLDDYFSVRPPAASYLDTRWNVADSVFLESDIAPPPPPQVSVALPDTMYAGGTATATAKVVVPAGMTHTVRWSASRADCIFETPTRATTTFHCPATAAGEVQATATVVDSDGMAASNIDTIKLAALADGRPVQLTGAVSRSSVVYGRAVRVTGRLTDAATGAGIGGMPVTLFSKAAGTTGFRTKNSGLTDMKGTITLPVRLSLSASLVMVAASTPTWAQSQSPFKTVAVRYAVSTESTAYTVRSGEIVRLPVTVLPADEGARVELRKPGATGSKTIAVGTVRSGGSALLSFTATSHLSDLRVVVPATEQHAAGRSAPIDITVR